MYVRHKDRMYEFKEYENRLYYCDMDIVRDKLKKSFTSIQTVKDKKRNIPSKI